MCVFSMDQALVNPKKDNSSVPFKPKVTGGKVEIHQVKKAKESARIFRAYNI